MIQRSLSPVVLALLAFGSLRLLVAQKEVQPTASQKPPVLLLKCPDIAVKNLQATLVSTLLGDLQVEFPMDTVRLESTLENTGSAAVPPGTSLYIILKRNGEVIQSASVQDVLGTPGSRWTYSVTDSFMHGQKTIYVIQVASTLKECRVSNNRAMHMIDEKKLHPSGIPDLAVSVFAIEKNWKHDGERFQASFDLEADVANNGTGYCNSASRLLFVLNIDQVVLATVNIPRDELPGPGEKKRFTAELTADQLPLGEFLVSAHIGQARNEHLGNNNWSPNCGRIANTAGPPVGAMAVLEFEPWHLAGKQLAAVIQITNLQNQHLRNLRLLMFKDNVLVREWRTLEFGPRETSHVRFSEERQPPQAISGSNRFRAVLTSDRGKTTPPVYSILDEHARNLNWVGMSEGKLQDNLQNKDDGLAAQVFRKNKNFLIWETRVKIDPAGIRINVKGKKIVGIPPDIEFHYEIVLLPRVVLDQVKLDVAKTAVHLGPPLSESFGNLLAPVICQSSKAVIEKFMEKELAAGLAKAPGSRYAAPIGLVPTAGVLDIYY